MGSLKNQIISCFVVLFLGLLVSGCWIGSEDESTFEEGIVEDVNNDSVPDEVVPDEVVPDEVVPDEVVDVIDVEDGLVVVVGNLEKPTEEIEYVRTPQIRLTMLSSHVVRLTWQNVLFNLGTCIIVERQQENSDFEIIAYIGRGTFMYSYIQSKVHYNYRVRVLDHGIYSEYSNVCSIYSI